MTFNKNNIIFIPKLKNGGNMLSFIGSIGPWEVIVILIIALLLFGAKKLPELGRAVGKGIREFKKGINEIENDIEKNELDKPKDPYLEINNQTKENEKKSRKRKQ